MQRFNKDNRPKWKHIGRKSTWLYPLYMTNHKGQRIRDALGQNRELILVESIGDAMALYEQGIKNVLVIFGLSVNNNIINYLSGKSISHIFIATNNDENSDENRGFIAAVKSYIKLSNYFDLDRLIVKFPPKPYNDFGDAHEGGYNLDNWLTKDIDKEAQLKYILDFVKNNSSNFTKKEIKTALILSDA